MKKKLAKRTAKATIVDHFQPCLELVEQADLPNQPKEHESTQPTDNDWSRLNKH